MIKSFLRSKVSLLDQTPTGRIINAFSNDTGIMDYLLGFCLFDSYEILIIFISFLVAMIIIKFYLSILVLAEILLIFSFYRYLKNIIIETRKLDLIYRSPIFSYFNSTIQGLLNIKIYG